MILKSLFLKSRQGLTLRNFLVSLCLLLLSPTAVSILILFSWNGRQALSIGWLLRPSFHLFLRAPIPHSRRPIIRWLRQPVGQVEEVLWNSDRAQQLVLRRLVLHIIVEIVHEQLLAHAHNRWHT